MGELYAAPSLLHSLNPHSLNPHSLIPLPQGASVFSNLTLHKSNLHALKNISHLPVVVVFVGMMESRLFGSLTKDLYI